MVGAVIVAVAFALAIASVWLTKPGSKLWKMRDTGYGDKLPSEAEWRGTQIRCTIVLAFLGAIFFVLSIMAT